MSGRRTTQTRIEIRKYYSIMFLLENLNLFCCFAKWFMFSTLVYGPCMQIRVELRPVTRCMCRALPAVIKIVKSYEAYKIFAPESQSQIMKWIWFKFCVMSQDSASSSSQSKNTFNRLTDLKTIATMPSQTQNFRIFWLVLILDSMSFQIFF